MAPKVSVIIPVYNNEKYVRRCVESILDQTLREIEVICINDGSTDSSKDILHEYAALDERVVVVDKENSGYGANMNIGFKKATGDYVAILESDDFADPEMLEDLYRISIENNLDVARANFSLFWSQPTERDEFLELFLPEECNRVIDPSTRPNQHCFYVQPAIWSALYKKSFIEENALTLLETPGAAYQDTAFNFKVWACARKVMFLNRPYIHYRQDNEVSSINNPGKIYCICDEYAEIERWLSEERPDLKEGLAPVAYKMQFDAYTWNCGRVMPEHRLEFAQLMSREFSRLDEEGLLDKSLFAAGQWNDCKLVMKDPEAFCRLVEKLGEDTPNTQKYFHKMRTLLHHLKYHGLKETLRLVKRKIRA